MLLIPPGTEAKNIITFSIIITTPIFIRATDKSKFIKYYKSKRTIPNYNN